MRLYFIISIAILLLCCCKEKDTLEENKKINCLVSLIAKTQEEIGKKCFVIGLIKKIDCLSCELSAAKFFSDSLTMNNSILISEEIRPIEKKDYLKKHNFLVPSKHQFNGELITNIMQELDIKFSSTTVIVVNKEGKIIQKGYLRDLTQTPDFYNGLCWKFGQ